MKQKPEFQNETYDLAIVLGGSIVDDRVFDEVLAGCRLIVCADGGARHLSRIGRMPDMLVGDMDSIQPDELAKLEAGNVRMRRFSPEKNFTDSELAVEAGLEAASDLVTKNPSTTLIGDDQPKHRPLRL